MYPRETLDLAAELVAVCRTKDVLIGTAESCTGGLIAGAITSVSGASSVFERGFNTYSNLAKTELLGVSLEDIATHGAVSSRVARQMAEGVLQVAPVHLTPAVTGIAGPGGGTEDKPACRVLTATKVAILTFTSGEYLGRSSPARVEGRIHPLAEKKSAPLKRPPHRVVLPADAEEHDGLHRK